MQSWVRAWNLCWMEIFSNRVRFALSTLGLFFGVTCLLYNLAFLRGIEGEVEKKMTLVGGTDILEVKARPPANPQEQIDFHRSPGMKWDDADRIAQRLPEWVRDPVLEAHAEGSPVLVAGKRSQGRIVGVVGPYFEAYNYSLYWGRSLTVEDDRRREAVCVLGNQDVEKLLPAGASALGRQIIVGGKPLRIVGILNTGDARNRRSSEVLIPLSVFRELFPEPGRNPKVLGFRLRPGNDARESARRIGAELEQMHRGVGDFEVELSEDRIRDIQTASLGLRVMLWSITAVVLLVSGVTIMNIMFATLGDRVRQIGVCKALGSSPADTYLQFNLESVLVCLLGALPGLAAGGSVTWFPADTFPFTPKLHSVDYVMAFMGVGMIGFLAGLFPSLRAARLPPVEALRY